MRNTFVRKNSTKASLVALAIAASVSMSTSAADKPWYVGVNVSEADLDSVETVSTAPVAGVDRTINLESDSETGFGIHIGREIFSQSNGNSLSFELSYSNSDHDLEGLQFLGNTFSVDAGTAEGSIELETLLARAVYKFDLGSFKPYLGVGIGETDLEVDARYGASVGQGFQAQPPFASGSDSAFAIELRGGVEYSISDQFDLFLEYTTTDVDDVEFFRTGGGPGGLATTTQSGDFDFDQVNLGAKFRF